MGTMGWKVAIGVVGAALAAGSMGAAHAATPDVRAAADRAVVTVSTPDLPTGESPAARGRWRDLRAEANGVLGDVASDGGLDVEARIPETGQIAVDLVGGSVAELRRRLGDDPRVLSVRADRPVTWRYSPSDPAIGTPDQNAPLGDVGSWNVIRSGALAAWDISKGAGAEVAVIDSGADVSHPDLSGHLAGTVDCTPNCAPGPVEDEDGHGTHVSGLACGDTDNGYGIASLGFDCNLWLAKVSLCSSVSQAIVQAANRGADAINLSLGDCDSGLSAAIDYAFASGSVPVAAGTNTPVPGGPNYPAQRVQPEGSGGDINAGRGLVVTAATYDGQRAAFAQRTSGVSIAAFGASSGLVGGPQGILSTWPEDPPSIETGTLIPPVSPCGCRTTLAGDDRFAYLVGTSMAAPQVAGLVALMRSVKPDLTAPKLVRLVKLSASNCGSYVDGTGWGLIDAHRAVAAAAGRDLDAPTSEVSGVSAKGVTVKRLDSAACSSELPISGVKTVEVFASANGGPYRLIGQTSGESLAFGVKKGKKAKKGKNRFRPKPGRRYRFYSVAVDGAGNREAVPPEPDATKRFKKKRKRKRR